MQQQANIAELQAQLTDVQDRLAAIQSLLMQNGQVLNDWIPESVAMGYGLKKSALFTLRKKGVLSSSKIGRKIYYRRSDFVRLLNDNEKNQ